MVDKKAKRALTPQDGLNAIAQMTSSTREYFGEGIRKILDEEMGVYEYNDATDLGRTKAVVLELHCPHCGEEAFVGFIPDKDIFGQCVNDHIFAVAFNVSAKQGS